MFVELDDGDRLRRHREKGKTMTKVSFDRSALRSAYLTTFDAFGVVIEDITTATKVETTEARRLMRELMRTGLVGADHVNGARELTYQCAETYDTIDRKTAIKRFQAVYGARGPIERAARVGATGPKYTDEQIATALKMRRSGSSWKAIGAKLGIKATAYLSKRLTPVLVEKAAPKATAKKSGPRPANKKPTPAKRSGSAAKRTVRVKAVAA